MLKLGDLRYVTRSILDQTGSLATRAFQLELVTILPGLTFLCKCIINHQVLSQKTRFLRSHSLERSLKSAEVFFYPEDPRILGKTFCSKLMRDRKQFYKANSHL